MRTSGRSLAFTAACAGALLYVGCVPIPNTRTVSPAMYGTVRRADGTPAAGVPLALSTDRDSACVRPSLRTTTVRRAASSSRRRGGGRSGSRSSSSAFSATTSAAVRRRGR